MLQLRPEFGEGLPHDAAHASVEHEDEDLALAKILQEQEHLFLRLRDAAQRRHATTTTALASGLVATNSLASTTAPENRLYARRDAADSSSDSASGSQDQSDSPADDDDMEFARKLQEEEDRAHYERMLQMAGLAAGANAAEEDQYLSDDDIDPDHMTYEQLQALGDTVGVVSRGASQNILNSLQKCCYAEHKPDHEGCSEQCTVCCMEFEAVDQVCVLGCKHCYHTDCIAQWLRHSKKCPICHTEVAAACPSSKTEGVEEKIASLLASKKA